MGQLDSVHVFLRYVSETKQAWRAPSLQESLLNPRFRRLGDHGQIFAFRPRALRPDLLTGLPFRYRFFISLSLYQIVAVLRMGESPP